MVGTEAQRQGTRPDFESVRKPAVTSPTPGGIHRTSQDVHRLCLPLPSTRIPQQHSLEEGLKPSAKASKSI